MGPWCQTLHQDLSAAESLVEIFARSVATQWHIVGHFATRFDTIGQEGTQWDTTGHTKWDTMGHKAVT